MFLLLLSLGFPSPYLTQTRPTDLVIVNANVRTLNSIEDRAEAIAVTGGRITAVGRNGRIKKLIGPMTRVVDAKGRLLIPGFNDAHVHFMGIGNSFSSIDLRGAATQQHIIERVEHYVRFLPKGRWILGGGWAEQVPDLAAIDKVSAEHPVFVYSTDHQRAFANGLAFKLAGLKSETGIERHPSGNPTGILSAAALRTVASVVPVNHTRDWPRVAETATNFAASLGVTSVQDMHSDDSREIYRELHRQGKLKTRIYDCISLPDWKTLVDSASLRRNDSMVRGGCLKSFSDGEEGSFERLLRDVTAADGARLQIAIHAIGNSANRIVLDVFERVTRSNGRRDRRFRVEHAHNPSTNDLWTFARSKIIASMQPHLFDSTEGGYYSTLLRHGTAIAFGSDAAITDLNPLLGIHAAVNAGPQSIPVYDAVYAYTAGSAYAEFQEKEKGTVATGKLADFVILSDDIFTGGTSKIREATVYMTIVGGEVVYQSK